jgi:hypothetical protein
MWKNYNIEIKFTSNFASSTPKNPKDIEGMLESRMMPEAEFQKRINAGEVLKTVDELAEQVEDEVQANGEVERGYATFKSDEKGLYYEGRCIRAHLKDCANILQKILDIKALKSKVANRVYVYPEKIYLGKKEPDGHETRIVHAMTMKGPRSSLKTIDFVTGAVLKFQIKVLDDGVIDDKLLKSLFEYGGIHGMGQERSQDWGRYDLVKLEAAA